MTEEFVGHQQSGLSLGLEYPYRLARLKGNFQVIDMPGRQVILGLNEEWVIFDYHTGKIAEHIPRQESEFFTEYFAVKRLYEINRASWQPSRAVLADIDASE